MEPGTGQGTHARAALNSLQFLNDEEKQGNFYDRNVSVAQDVMIRNDTHFRTMDISILLQWQFCAYGEIYRLYDRLARYIVHGEYINDERPCVRCRGGDRI